MKRKPAKEKPESLAPVAEVPVQWDRNWVFALALVVMALLAYYPAWHAGFTWDDDVYVTENTLLSAPDGLSRIWFSLHRQSQYFPLVYTTFRIEYAFWGLNPTGYHVVNILLHGVNAILVWMLLRRLKMSGAWLAAAVFALHPVQVETVAWITETKNTESTLFYLLALLAWLKFVESSASRRWCWYLLALGAGVLALFAKTTACTLPAALLLVLWFKNQPINVKRAVQVVPFALVGLVMGCVAIWWEHHMGHYALEPGAQAGPMERLLQASRAFWFYVGKLIWPVNLTFSYARWQINPRDLGQYVWLAGCLVAAGLLWWKRKAIGRGWIVGILFFVAALSPLLGFIWVYTFRYSYVADHYQYLACLGLIAPAAALAARRTQNWNLPLRAGLSLALLLGLATLTWRQAGTYTDVETLWRTTIARSPNSWMAHNNLGVTLIDRKQPEEAMRHLQRAVELKPDEPNIYNNIATIYSRTGRSALALPFLEKALQLDPNLPLTHNNIGTILRDVGRLDDAIKFFTNAIKLDPYYTAAYNNLGVAFAQAGRPDEAIARFQKALELRPDYADAHNNFANVLLETGHADLALAHYRQALRARPDYADAHSNLGTLLFSAGYIGDAILEWRAAVDIDPRCVNARDNLAWVRATSPIPAIRNGTEAVTLALEANELCASRNPKILRTLAASYAETKQFAQALTVARQALQLLPEQAPLAQALIEEMGLYQAGQPFRDLTQTNSLPPSNQR